MKKVFYKSIFKKSLGLMFRKAKNNTLYIFVFKNGSNSGFHMNFVPKAIDIYFLDKDKKILDMKKNFKPWTNYKSKKKFYYAIETKQGLLNKKIGEKISF